MCLSGRDDDAGGGADCLAARMDAESPTPESRAHLSAAQVGMVSRSLEERQFEEEKGRDAIVTIGSPKTCDLGQTLPTAKCPNPCARVDDWRILLHPAKTRNLA